MAKYTLTNLLTNSSFENTGWGNTAYCTLSYDNTVKKYGDYSLKVTATRTSSGEVYFANSTNVNMIQNHIYYACCELYQTSSVCSGMQAYWPQTEPNMGTASVSETNKWVKCGFRASRTNWSGSQNFRFDIENIVAPNYVYLDGAMLIDLTEAFGSGNEPSVEWCNSNIKYFEGTKTISASLPVTYDLTSTVPSKLKTGDILNCPYSGTAKSITLPKGTYKLECWGAQGGSYSSYYGGNGGYSYGTITLTTDTLLYLYTGGQPITSTSSSVTIAGGFNGGGKARYHSYRDTTTYCQAGGGASDIRIGIDSLYARVIVAGGGGGSASVNAATTKYGGGTSGGSPVSVYAATQTSAGTNGSFGIGADGDVSGYNYKYASGGGGGGWYGGGAINKHSDSNNYRGHNGGGSGYVYTSSTASNYPSGCLLNSSYYLTDASTVAGNTSFTGISGSSETGHSGNGYIRITAIKVGSVTFRAKRSLPQEPYLESSGTQYIDTGFIPNCNTRVKMECEIVDIPVNGAFFGAINASTAGGQYSNTLVLLTSLIIRSIYYGNAKSAGSSVKLGDRLYIDKNKNIATINNIKLTNTASSTGASQYSMYLFGANTSNSYVLPSNLRLYSCQIYDNDVLVRDFIPTLDGSNVACLLDRVNNTYYYNQGTGDFTYGVTNVDTPYEIITTNIGYTKVSVTWKPIISWFTKVNGEWKQGV